MRTLLAIVLLAAPAARAEPTLARGVALFNDFQDAQAAQELHAFLAVHPSGLEAAKAHVYLGLVALNALDSDRARAEFKAALAIEPTVEVPYEASPKARVVFDQAQREFVQQQAQAPKPRVQPLAGGGPAAVPVVVENGPPPQRPEAKSKVPGIVLASLAVAVVGTGAGFGLWQNQLLSPSWEQQNVPARNAGAVQAQAGTAGIVADVCFGVGGAVGIAALVVLVNELSGHTPSHDAEAARVQPAPGGMALAF